MANGYQPLEGETWGKANTTQPIFFYRFFLQPKE